MAPALSSSSFRLGATQPQSKPHHRPSRSTTRAVAVFARQAGGNSNVNGAPPFSGFRIGGRDRAGEGQGDQREEEERKKKKKPPFFVDIDLGKLVGTNTQQAVPAGGSTPSTALFFGNWRRKDPRTVFVAGATGQAGVRIARTLLRQGFSVRAGVPELAAAQDLARVAVQYRIISAEESKRLNAVESAFRDAESIARAIGNAAKVVVTVGRGEDGPAGEVTTDDALLVVRAAQLAGVAHVAVVYDTSGGPPGPSTYNVLDGITSFFSNLLSRSRLPLTVSEFLKKVAEETEVRYTLLKACLADDYEAADGAASGGLVVTGEGAGTWSDYKVSKSQIASLVADVFSNTAVAENKVVEVSTSPSAPSKSVEELFSAIQEDGRRKAYQEALAKAKAEEEALVASVKAREDTEAAKKLEEEVKKLSEQEPRAARLAEEARQKAEVVGSSMESILTRAKGLGADFSWDKLSSQFSTAIAKKSEDAAESQVATVRGQAKARALPSQKAVVKQPVAKSKPRQPEPRAKPRQVEQKPEVKKVLGGLFKQETIYIDDD